MQVTLKMLNFICVSLFAVMQLVEGFDIPAVTVEAVKPEGLRVSIPADDKDVKFFEFHANVNKVIEEKEPGDIFNRVSAPYENKWQFTDKTVSLKKNDVLNYWVLVWKNGESYTKHGLSRKIEDLVE